MSIKNSEIKSGGMQYRSFLIFILLTFYFTGLAQSPVSVNSADLYLQIKKLKVLGAVLYVAAHPDDENTRLLAYLSKEKLYKTGYLSITRGDGGQNLIGDEQGIDLGLIRTQELLAARRIDGAEQFFTRAYDFGYSKSNAETFSIWDKDKILSDVVWVIRKFQPDVIITRFPEDTRAGHGHHSGSAVLAHEGFIAAADPARYPEQFKFGVKPWKAKRIVWNTFNFGNTNTTADNQMKIDVGGYNPILGKSYGEIAAESRSQHKSQGFGVPASRGTQLEYFTPIAGDPASNDLHDGIDFSWNRIEGGNRINEAIDSILQQFSLSNPELSVPALVRLYNRISQLKEDPWKHQKLNEISKLIEGCSGLWLEAYSNGPFAVHGDSIRLNVFVNNRLGAPVEIRSVSIPGFDTNMIQSLQKNRNYNFTKTIFVSPDVKVTQPYWLEQPMKEGYFNVTDQHLIGIPDVIPAFIAKFDLKIDGNTFMFTKPIRYKYTDPVKGELYEPLVVIPAASLNTEPAVVIFRKNEKQKSAVRITLQANRTIENNPLMLYSVGGVRQVITTETSLQKGLNRTWTFDTDNSKLAGKDVTGMQVYAKLKEDTPIWRAINSIRYDHIPPIHYLYPDSVKILNIDLKIAGKKIGYIEGAGDKVIPALEQMGYEVIMLKERDLNNGMLRQFDAIITGVRAYNVHPFLPGKYEVLMEYVNNGGNLIVQYNTNNQAGPLRTKLAPFPFTISRGRITDEKSQVTFLLPEHPVLNFPNKITTNDFNGWVQERGIYFADQLAPQYQTPLSMSDKDEPSLPGGLIIADYGKGKFVYTGIVFFRQLPAGVPGAYRLLANIIALNKKKAF